MRTKKQTSLDDKAWRATQKFRTLLPMLNSFARALSGNPSIRVEVVEAGCYSDANTIYMAPPIGLGEEVRHIRSLCDRRDENLQHTCLACAQQEEVLYKVFHEMGHQVYGTHDKFADGLSRDALRNYAGEVWNPDFPIFAGSLRKKIAAAEKKGNNSDCVMGLANALHPWLGLVVNAVEDVRVDSRTFAARAGVRVMAQALAYQVMAEGLTDVVDGKLVTEYWSDRSIDMQVLVGLLNHGFEYDLDEFISEEARAVLDDPTLVGLCQDMKASDTEAASFKLSCEILHRLHQLGLCDPPPEEEEEPEPEPEEGDGDSEEKEEEKEEEPDTTETEKLKSLMACVVGEGAASDEDGDKAATAIALAVIQSEWFEQPSKKIMGVRINHFKDRNKSSSRRSRYDYDYDYSGWETGYERTHEEYMPSESIIGKALTKARIVFSANQRSKLVRNQKSGRISKKKLYKAALEDDRLYSKKIRPDKRNYHFVIMADISGSNESGDRMPLNKKMLLAQGELLGRLGVSFEIYAHTGRSQNLQEYSSELMLDIYPVKEAHETWGAESRKRIANLKPAAANLDGHAMEFARKKCDESRAYRKIILYSSDGAMPCENYEEELVILKSELATCKKKRYITRGIGLYTDEPTRHGLETVQVRSAADISQIVAQIEKELD